MPSRSARKVKECMHEILRKNCDGNRTTGALFIWTNQPRDVLQLVRTELEDLASSSKVDLRTLIKSAQNFLKSHRAGHSTASNPDLVQLAIFRSRDRRAVSKSEVDRNRQLLAQPMR